MKIVQNIKIVSEITKEELKKVDLNEYEQELYEQIRSETDEDAIIEIEVTVEE